ncbi:MAG: helix-hairpin-helix domain-containing protein [Paludibacteraceae bacterium]|nr:helix-hairpin-helix domain-containing protein [Paludibacteraceae bacterium]
MKKQRKIYFLLTAEQWLGVALLVILVVGTLMAVKHFQPEKEEDSTRINDSTMTHFTAHQAQQDSIRKTEWEKRYPRDTIEIRMQAFNPNTADSSTLVHLGFKPWQAKNMLKYRAKGGKYRKPDDLKRLYGMTDSMYQALAPYIHIAREEMDSLVDSVRVYSLPQWQKENKDTIINLRTTDTIELKMLYGIGSYRARQIVRYREQLGGFVRVEQVLEAKGMDGVNADTLLQHLYMDSVIVEQIPINQVGVQRLARHPYLRFEQAKAIYELRRRKIRLDSIQQLNELDYISTETLEKIAPYLNFDKN